MKKTLLFIAFAAFTFAASAQGDMTNKKGTNILPEAGDWGLGWDAVPFIEYAGNLANGTDGQSSFSPNFTSNSPTMTIYGKKCVTANKFYRARVRLGFGNDKSNYPIIDDHTDGNSGNGTAGDTVSFVEQYGNDEAKNNYMQINLGAGIEHRHGVGRVQGICGYEAMIGFGSSKTTHSFVNAIDSSNQSPSTGIPSAWNSSGQRITEIKNGSSFEFGIRGFVGVEYMVAAKIGISAEFGWGIGMSSIGAGETTTEYYESSLNNGAGGVRTQTLEGPGKWSAFGLDTDNAYGSLNVFFYFAGGGAK